MSSALPHSCSLLSVPLLKAPCFQPDTLQTVHGDSNTLSEAGECQGDAAETWALPGCAGATRGEPTVCPGAEDATANSPRINLCCCTQPYCLHVSCWT